MSKVHQTIYEATTGQIRYSVQGNSDFLVLDLEEGFAQVDGEWSSATHYIDNGTPASRPTTGLPATHSIAASTDWLVPNVPVGTLVLIDGEDAGTVGTGDLVLSFALAGVWQVELRPPFPWIEAKCEVTVT